MKTSHFSALLLTFVIACGASSAEATDRMRAGQWVGTWTGAGRTRATSNCMAQSDVDAMNGDAKSIQAYLEKTIPPTICKLSDIKVKGNDVIYLRLRGWKGQCDYDDLSRRQFRIDGQHRRKV
jgi:hypothetical protein